MTDVVVVGAGIGGMSAAIAAAARGLDVVLLEKGARVGGAAAYSGGQVWVGGNHVAEREGLSDSVADTLAYVAAAASRDEASLDHHLAAQWIEGARTAARWFEDAGVISWQVIPDYPDYYFPDLPGSRPAGRYLTGAPFDGGALGPERDRLLVSPHFPVGITYAEMFAWGGLSSKTEWDWDLVARRRDADVLTFGTGIAAAFFRGVLDHGVDVRTGHEVVGLVVADGAVTGVRVRGPEGEEVVTGRVVLATGAHDWSEELTAKFTGIPPEDGGSVAPGTLSGDAIALVEQVGGSPDSLPAWAAPVLPGYRLDVPAFEGDTGFRACYEHCLPHTFLVNSLGERFCDDSFHSRIVAAALSDGDSGGNLPFFMIWDSRHHRRYGLGATPPGGEYPAGLVERGATLADLARELGLPPETLEATAARFNRHAPEGVDPDFGRGTNLSVRKFRGDGRHAPNPNVGPVSDPPFFGMRMRLLNTGIAAAGVRTGDHGRVLDGAGAPVPGLYAAGECSARAAAGVGYNSGYSLSRAMAYGFLAAQAIADTPADRAPQGVDTVTGDTKV
ncbi:FAD-dependent oxidoreductase [Pseudonocardia oceani]|uniref:FAD-dependent oxidoreductase n=1 Tax=Pseudonocardia oceani TaxID=2792013 RepID=A0ABS6UFA3_9PSEU|nr:FAD-dependent oxidoreductase [Pseudonocardia oceani]MBW0130921.1 FAD-dependent oxidoreductase [Pseudonocardia oceani]